MPPKKKFKVKNPGKPIIISKAPKKKKFKVRNPGKPIDMTPKPKTAGQKLTGLKPSQMNAMTPEQLFGMLPPEIGKKVLSPSTTGIQVGRKTTEQLVEIYRTYRRSPTLVVRKEWSEGKGGEVYTPETSKAME